MKKVLLTLFLLFLTSPAFALPAHVQSACGGDSTASFGSLPAVGNLVIIPFVVTSSNNTDNYTLTDNQSGNTYYQIARVNLGSGIGDGGASLYIAYGVVKKSSGTFTVTLSPQLVGAVDLDYSLCIHEYSGLNFNSNLNISSSSFSSSSNTTANPGAINSNFPNTLYFSASFSDATSAATALNSFNLRQSANGTTSYINTEDKVGTGSQTGSFTIVSSPWVALAVSFATTTGLISKGNLISNGSLVVK